MMRARLWALAAGVVVAALIGCANVPDPVAPAQPSAAGVAVSVAAAPSTAARPSERPAVPSRSVFAAPTTLSLPSASALGPSPSVLAAPAFDLVLRGATLIDGTGAPPLPDAAVAIRGDRIAWAGPAADLAVASGTPVRELHGATVLPGLVNVHAHTAELGVDELRAWTRAGVTTLRDLGGPRDAILRRGAELAARADVSLPRLLVSGPILTVPGGHPIPVDGPSDRALAVEDAPAAAAQTARLLDDGAQVIKIAVSGRSDVAWPELSDEQIRAIADTAHARGARVSAHVDRAVALRRAVENGIDDAAHMPRDSVPDDVWALMAERGVALVPTIHVYEQLAQQRGSGDEWRRTTQPVMYDNLRRFVAAGGTLALGDDYGNPGVPLGMPLTELRHWLAAGISPLAAITAATSSGAAVSGLEQLGRIQPDFLADVLVVDGDPLVDIAALERPLLVLRDGRVVWER